MLFADSARCRAHRTQKDYVYYNIFLNTHKYMRIYIGEKDHPGDGGWRVLSSTDGSHAPLYLAIFSISFKEEKNPLLKL